MSKASEVLEIKSALRQFVGHMEKKLVDKARGGWEGWDHKHFGPTAELRLLNHAGRLMQGDKGQAVDVANFAMFIWWIEKMKNEEEAGD